jgi:hypothetical protein
MKFASVKQAVKFGIEAGLPSDMQVNLCNDCKMSSYLILPFASVDRFACDASLSRHFYRDVGL